MKSNFDDISKDILILHIYKLLDSMNHFKLGINISIGKVMNIEDDRISIQGKGFYSNMGIKSVRKDDLIIILRFLENLNKCKEIVVSNVKYGEIFDVRNMTINREPCNKKEIKQKIKDFLSRKKYIAVIDRRK